MLIFENAILALNAKSAENNIMDDWQMDANIITLYELSVFNKKTFFDTITDDVGVLSKSTLEKYLKKYLESGEIVRIGRNAYCVRGKLKDYEYDYSDIAVHIAKI